MSRFKPAVRERVLLRAALIGPSGSGKTLGALNIAQRLAGDARFAVVDTEHGRAKLYANQYSFDHDNLYDTRPEGYVEALRDAQQDGYTVLVFDSLSHEWLNILTEADRFSNWKDLTPRHNEFVQAIAASPLHVICTMRAKTKYDVSEEQVPGRAKPKQVITRLGVGPVQREGLEYEFDVLVYLDTAHDAQFSNRGPLVGQTVPFDEEALDAIIRFVEQGEGTAELPPVEPPRIGATPVAAQPTIRATVKQPTATQRKTFAELLERLSTLDAERKWMGDVIEPWVLKQTNGKGIDDLSRDGYELLLDKVRDLLDRAEKLVTERVPFGAPPGPEDLDQAAKEEGMESEPLEEKPVVAGQMASEDIAWPGEAP